jgi:trehalose 6-phosphate phosphatase
VRAQPGRPAKASGGPAARTPTPATSSLRAGRAETNHGVPGGGHLLRPGEGFGPFFAALRSGESRALLLDYDGTLAPFSERRQPAPPYRWVRPTLERVASAPRPTRVGIVSGRPVADVARLSGLEGAVELWGSHGLERLTLEGCWVGPAPRRDASEFLETVAAAITARGWAGFLERKPYGLAIHARGASPAQFADAESELIEQWADSAEPVGLELLGFDGGVELRPAGVGKGLVVRKVLEELGPDASIAYLGDDRTDEDAFEELGDRGLAVLVRPEPRATRAAGWVRSPEELRRFLADWNAACSEEDG